MDNWKTSPHWSARELLPGGPENPLTGGQAPSPAPPSPMFVRERSYRKFRMIFKIIVSPYERRRSVWCCGHTVGCHRNHQFLVWIDTSVGLKRFTYGNGVSNFKRERALKFPEYQGVRNSFQTVVKILKWLKTKQRHNRVSYGLSWKPTTSGGEGSPCKGREGYSKLCWKYLRT